MANLDLYFRLDHRVRGKTRSVGSLVTPFPHSVADVPSSFETPGNVLHLVEGESVPAGEFRVLWDYTSKPLDPTFFVVNPSVLGYFWVWVDKPVSDEDQSPSGTHGHWYPIPGGCGTPQTLSSRFLPTVPAATNPTTDDGGTPAMVFTLGAVTGRIYKIGFACPTGGADSTVDLALTT